MIDAATERIARDYADEPRLAGRLKRYAAVVEKIRAGECPHCGG